MTSAKTPWPFDSVLVGPGANKREYTPEQFFALPLNERVNFLLRQQVMFLLSGQQIDISNVLAALRNMHVK